MNDDSYIVGGEGVFCVPCCILKIMSWVTFFSLL